ncbi:MAG TPA: hypothetical protein PLF21_06350 [Exilispira sp.]|nr:hypothetical protein [Exilispira sp.]
MNKEYFLYFLLFFLIFIFIFSFFSFVNTTNADASIQISEGTLNKFLAAVGDLTNTEKFNILGLSGTYTWLVQNPQIKLTGGKAQFTGDVTITINPGNIVTKSNANGEVSVNYDINTNKIQIRVTKAIVEIKTKIMGNMVKIAEIDLAKYYQIAFDFPGPKPFESSVDVKMPDGKIKKIKIDFIPVLTIIDGAVVVGSELRYSPIN